MRLGRFRPLPYTWFGSCRVHATEPPPAGLTPKGASMLEVIRNMYAYSDWANVRILETTEQLDPRAVHGCKRWL